MKKGTLLVILVTLSALLASAQTDDKFKPCGRILGLLFADFHTTFSGEINSSAFEITRSYLGFDYSFSQKFSSRMLYDATAETIDGKTLYSGYLRNAYLQYINSFITLRGGLIGAEQLSVIDRIWDYRYITKPTIDYSSMVYSADLGITTKLKAADQLVIDLSVTNGRGYKDISPDGTYRIAGGVTITLLKNLIVRGYGDMMGPSGRMQWTTSVTGAYVSKVFTAGAEYLRQNNHSMNEGYDYSGLSIFTAVKLTDRISLFARYDSITSVAPEGASEPWNIANDGTRLFTGIDFSPARNVRISPNFIGYMPSDHNSDFTGTIGLNVEARF
jgi:hypothetical protein